MTRLRLTRRDVLVGLGGMALLAACGDDDTAVGTDTVGTADSADTGETTESGGGEANEEGFALIQFFAPEGALAADEPNRVTFGLGTAAGALRSVIPDEIAVRLLDDKGSEIDRMILPSLGDGLPRRYYALETTGPAGIYTIATEVEHVPLELAFQIQPADQVALVQPGDPMRPVETPTFDDARGVSPICTRPEPCRFHDETLTDALAGGGPVALLIATPTFCQTAVCGPVLDIMIDASSDYPGVRFIHAEVFANPEDGINADTQTTEAVNTYGMEFEPSLIVADADSTVVKRLDFIFGDEELRGALDLVAG